MSSSTVSVSKGVFIYKNGAKAASKKTPKKAKPSEGFFCDTLWYQTYKNLWNNIEANIQELNNEMFSGILSSLTSYLQESYRNVQTEIPAAALLTGINMPDHTAQFKTLRKEIKTRITPHVCTLNGEDCQNLKYLVEIMANQLINGDKEVYNEDDSDFQKIKKSQCSFALIQSWYEDLYLKQNHEKPIIIVIIPDFENFASKVLQDLILIAHSYINILPFVFVFGVATSLAAVHRSLPCHVSSKIKIQVFHSSPSTVYLNNVIENIFFSLECPFHLGGKVFNLFTDIFLFYDLSVNGFIQNFKYAMLEHFSYGNAMALCQSKHIKNIVERFNHEDVENARQILSFRKLVEGSPPEIRICLLTDDKYFKEVLKQEVKKIIAFLPNFHLFLKCLHILVLDLPKAPLGKQLRELYASAVSKPITSTPEYKECFQLLSFQSYDELYRKIEKIKNLILNNSSSESGDVRTIINDFDEFLMEFKSVGGNSGVEDAPKDGLNDLMSRLELKEKLLEMSQKPQNSFEKARQNLLSYLTTLFDEFLPVPSSFYFHEIFFFNDISIQPHVVGTHRAAIHTALNDPQFYLQCQCCDIPNDSIILQNMPDISIAYKLHLECGKMINLYDWLQSFVSILDPQQLDDDSNPTIDLGLQARFTQSVAELEFLGFIKSSKRKTDHVARLTWGG